MSESDLRQAVNGFLENYDQSPTTYGAQGDTEYIWIPTAEAHSLLGNMLKNAIRAGLIKESEGRDTLVRQLNKAGFADAGQGSSLQRKYTRSLR